MKNFFLICAVVALFTSCMPRSANNAKQSSTVEDDLVKLNRTEDSNKKILKTILGVTDGDVDRLASKLALLGLILHESDPDYNAVALERALEVISTINDFFGSDPQFLPINLKVRTHLQSYGGTSYVAGRIEITDRIELASGTVLSPELSRYATAHEYGHAIFDVMMSRINVTYREHIISKTQYFNNRETVEALAKINSSDPEIERLIQRNNSLIRDRLSEVQNVYGLLLPYNEFFADVVGVLYAKDEHAMTKIVDENPQWRDFTRPISMDDWIEIDNYGAFAPTRSQLGHLLDLRSGTITSRAKTLWAVIKVINDRYREIMSLDGYKLNPANVAEANKDFIRRLKNELN